MVVLRSFGGAFLAAAVWLGFALLLLVHNDALSLKFNDIANHILGNYSLLLIGMLVFVDVLLDVYLVGSRNSFFTKWPISWAIMIIVLLLAFVFTVVGQSSPDWKELCAAAGLSCLFLIRMVSYLKVANLTPVPVNAMEGST